MLNNAEFLKLFLPELLIEHFEIIKFEEENKIPHLYFEEKIQLQKSFFRLFCNQKDSFLILQLMIFRFAEKP